MSGMNDRTALVVGGTSGIGLATARRLHTLGATVHIVGRGKQRLDDIAATDPAPGRHAPSAGRGRTRPDAIAAPDPAMVGPGADGSNRNEIPAVLDTIGRIDW